MLKPEHFILLVSTACSLGQSLVVTRLTLVSMEIGESAGLVCIEEREWEHPQVVPVSVGQGRFLEARQ